MKEINKSRARRRNLTWKRAEIEKLIEWGLVKFLPLDYEQDKRLSDREHSRILKTVTSRFTDEQLEGLDRELEMLKRLGFEKDELDDAIWKSATFVIPFSEDITGSSRANTYLRASLHLPISLSGTGIRAAAPRDQVRFRRQALIRTKQRACFLNWCGISENLWKSTTWRECLMMRYRDGDPSAMSFISKPVRRILNREVARLRKESGTKTTKAERLEEAAAKVGFERYIGQAHQLIRVEYMRAALQGQVSRGHFLYRPISRSGLFERVAEVKSVRSASGMQSGDSDKGRFVRYLSVPAGRADELLGQILYELLKLETGFWDHPGSSPPPLEGVRWPARLKIDALRKPKDFETVADRIVAALEIDPRMMSDVWQAYVTLRLRRFWEKRAPVSLTVYWAAFLLEGLRSYLYRLYGRHLDHFLVEGIRPLMKKERSGKTDGPMRRAALEPLMKALDDPLLKCVLHSELFDGKKRLFPRTEKRRQDSRIRAQLIVYTVDRLRQEHPERPSIAVTDVLADAGELGAHVTHAARPSKRDLGESIQGYSHYAYVAPIIAAIIDDPHWLINADNVKETYLRYRDDAETAHLLADLGQESVATIRGRI